MSDAELRKQGRYTWLLVAFTVVVMLFLLQHSRATAEGESAKPAVTHTNGQVIEVSAEK